MPSALWLAQRSRGAACLQLPFGSCVAKRFGFARASGLGGRLARGPPPLILSEREGVSGWPYEGHPLGPAPGQLLRSCPAALLQGAPVCDWLPGEPAVRGPGAGADTHFQWECGREAGEKLGGGKGTRAKPPAPILSGRGEARRPSLRPSGLRNDPAASRACSCLLAAVWQSGSGSRGPRGWGQAGQGAPGPTVSDPLGWGRWGAQKGPKWDGDPRVEAFKALAAVVGFAAARNCAANAAKH